VNKKDLTETDIRTKFITPAILGPNGSKWNVMTQVLEERYFTKGRIIVRGKTVQRGEAKKADYILFYKPHIPIAVVEAKDNNHSVGAGMQQALDYAETLDGPAELYVPQPSRRKRREEWRVRQSCDKHCDLYEMKEIRLKLADLFEVDPQNAERPNDLAAITAYVLRQYAFLPKPIAVTLEGEEVVISYPEEPDAKREEAARLTDRAVKRASEGQYEKAIGIYKRVLELQPSFHAARRDLAMAYMETGDVENATNHLIEVLRLDPKDVWSWVVLGNLYIREKGDLETGEKFLRKALELKPDDAWALNSLAAGFQKNGQTGEAIDYFDKAISANPKFANPYYGKALTLAQDGQSQAASDTLTQLFAEAKTQDARSKPVFDGARELYVTVQRKLAAEHHSDAFAAGNLGLCRRSTQHAAVGKGGRFNRYMGSNGQRRRKVQYRNGLRDPGSVVDSEEYS
jgi:tetratricopeptide (TPR) repeat protein